MEMDMDTKFFAFRQNNSGGSFDHKPAEGIGIVVWVEAVDEAHANARAELIGLYFDGCRNGMDCSCCGDRWSEAYSRDGSDRPELYGVAWRAVDEGEEPTLDWNIPSYIHRMDGGFKAAKKVSA
jgi:hypothetical protein